MYYNLLVHVDLPEEQRFGMALSNVENYRAALPDESFEVVVLANAGAVRFLKRDDNAHAEGVRALAEQGVVFRACRNALRKAAIDPAELLDCVAVVPAGIVEIVRLQREGYAYIKP